MPILHIPQHALHIVEAVAAGGLATAVTLASLIAATTLIYVWFIA